MSKQDSIPPHILDMAELEVRRWPLDTNCVPEVARIIMAAEKRGEEREREACAELSIKEGKHLAEAAIGSFIAKAIRKRGETIA